MISEDWKKKNTKQCPQRGTSRKMSGCSHIHCAKCNADFDYNTMELPVSQDK